MARELATKDERPIAAWVLKANPNMYDVLSEIRTQGAILSWSVSTTYRADLMDVDQRCFLYVGEKTDGSIQPGIWAAGTVRGRVAAGAASDSGWHDKEYAEKVERFAPVFLLPLRSIITRKEMKAHPVLAGCELLRSTQQSNPVVLRADELKAIEEWDLTPEDLTEEQLDHLATITEEGLILTVLGVSQTLTIWDETDEDPAFAVYVAEVNHDDGHEIGRFESFDQALAAAKDEVGRFKLPTAGPANDSDDHLVAVAQYADSEGVVYRTEAAVFSSFDPELGLDEPLDVSDDLQTALDALFADVEWIDADEDLEA